MDPLTKYLLSAQKLGASFQAFYLKCSNVSDQIIVSEVETQHREKSFESHLFVNFPAKTEALTRATSLPFRDNLCCSRNYSCCRLRIPFLLHRPLHQEHSFSSSLHPPLCSLQLPSEISCLQGDHTFFFHSFLQVCFCLIKAPEFELVGVLLTFTRRKCCRMTILLLRLELAGAEE